MSPEEKSEQYLNLNANQRLFEIQAEIVKIEKKRINEKLSKKETEELREKIKFLVLEERLILEARYAKQKDIKDAERTVSDEQEKIISNEKNEIKTIIEKEIVEDQKIEVGLGEIIKATKERKWHETWWGKIVIIVAGTILLSLLTNQPINFSNLVV